jgi:predicted nucleic acid-binding protein
LLATDDVALCGPIVTEIRRGLRGPRDRTTVLPLLGGCHSLAAPADLWTEAGDLGYALRRVGRTIKTVDLLIAVFALSHGLPILTADADFTTMRRAGVGLLLAEVG